MVQSLTERLAEGAAQATLGADRRQRDSEAHRDELDWDGFRDLYYPDSRRHDLKAIVAYGSYKKSPPAGQQQASEAHPKGVAIATEALSLDEWEDEGGASP
jgi:hypothetical protein